LIVVVVAAPIVLTAASAGLARVMPDAGLVQSVAAIGQVLALGVLVIVPLGAAERMDQVATETLQEARRIREEAGEQHVILAALGAQLLEVPAAPPGWDLGFRQTAAFAALPGDTCQLLLDDTGERFLVAVIDVAGHGTESALQALRLRTEVAALWRVGESVAAIGDALDRSVAELGTIATGLLLSVELDSEACQYVNAGHPALLVEQGDGTLVRWEPTRPLLGIAHGVSDAVDRTLGRHCIVVAYTDGVVEARSSDRRLLGEEAVAEALRRHAPSRAQAVADACMDAALAHSNARLRDDALTLVLQRL
jgi:serine phosphatase RsbU (regulator of sigma subunit)